MKFSTAFQDHQAWESAVKFPFQGHNRMARVGFEQRSFRSQSRRFKYSTTLEIIPKQTPAYIAYVV